MFLPNKKKYQHKHGPYKLHHICGECKATRLHGTWKHCCSECGSRDIGGEVIARPVLRREVSPSGFCQHSIDLPWKITSYQIRKDDIIRGETIRSV